MSVSTMLDIFGSLLTAGALIFGIFRFQYHRDAEVFATLRDSLQSLSILRERMNYTLTESSFSEIGVSVADQLDELCQEGKKKEDAIDLLTNPNKRNYVITAIDLGLRNSEARREALSAANELNSIPFSHKAQMPLLTALLKELLAHYTWSVTNVTDRFLYIHWLLNEDPAREELLSRIRGIEDPKLAFREIAEFLSTVSFGYLQEHSTPLREDVERILDVLAPAILKKNNRQMKKFRDLDQAGFAKKVPDDVKTSIGYTFHLLEQIRTEFREHEWGVITAAKERIYVKTRS